jgi:predicted permease
METIVLSLLGTTIGLFLGRFKLIGANFTRSLGRSLYRFGLPLQIFVLAHNTTLIKDVWFPPFITILVLLLGLILANLNLFYGQQLSHRFFRRPKGRREGKARLATTNLTARESVGGVHSLKGTEEVKKKSSHSKTAASPKRISEKLLIYFNRLDLFPQSPKYGLRITGSPPSLGVRNLGGYQVMTYTSQITSKGQRDPKGLANSLTHCTPVLKDISAPADMVFSSTDKKREPSYKVCLSKSISIRTQFIAAAIVGQIISTKGWRKSLFSLFRHQTKEFDLPIPQHASGQGSFILASTLGSTGYLGLSIVPLLVGSVYSGWAVLYSVTQILFGSFGMGVILANYYGSSQQKIGWLIQLQELVRVPALWAFLIGWYGRSIDFSSIVDGQLQFAVSLVIAGAFLLTGIQVQAIKQFNLLNKAILPALLKMLVIPGLTGLFLTWFGFTGDARLSMVLMSGMPTANTNLILAEEYNLDRQITASSIALSTVLLPVMIVVWQYLYKVA